MRYYTHGSLASGFLTGKYRKGVPPVRGVDRFAQKRRARQYEERYLKRDEMFAALDVIGGAASEAGISTLAAGHSTTAPWMPPAETRC